MKFDALRLTSGHGLQIVSVDDETDRLHADYVGAVEGKAILITIPKATVIERQVSKQSKRLQVGDKVKVGLLGSNGPASFTSQVMSVTGMPLPLLYLTYPTSINYAQSRKHDRVHVSLPIKVVVSGVETLAEFSDLSLSGGRILSDESLGQIGEPLTCIMTLQIDELQKELTVEGTIRAHHQGMGLSASNVYGIEFSSLTEADRLVLRSFIHVSLEQGSV